MNAAVCMRFSKELQSQVRSLLGNSGWSDSSAVSGSMFVCVCVCVCARAYGSTA